MIRLVDEIIFRAENIANIIPDELTYVSLKTIITFGLFLALFYYMSNWFKAYILRLFIFIFGIVIVWETIARDTILFNLNFYFGLGILSPHIEIVEISYLILREKFLGLYYRILDFIKFVLTPLFWSYNKSQNIYYFFKSKSEQRRYKQEKKKYEEQSKRHYEQEQKKQDEYTRKEEQKRRYNQQQEQRKREEKYQKKKSTKNYSRWDSSNPYEVLGIDKEATSKEIKKAYRNLSKVYHPDMTLTKKEEYLIIFQKINSAYEKLKK